MNTKSKIAVAIAMIAAISSPIFAGAASAAQKHSYDAGAYASTGPVLQPGSLTEQRWFDRASSPRND